MCLIASGRLVEYLVTIKELPTNRMIERRTNATQIGFRGLRQEVNQTIDLLFSKNNNLLVMILFIKIDLIRTRGRHGTGTVSWKIFSPRTESRIFLVPGTVPNS